MAIKKRDFRPVWAIPRAPVDVRLQEARRLLLHFKRFNKEPHLTVWKQLVRIYEKQLRQSGTQ